MVNREVVVRVFSGGDPVPGLTEKDFILYENGKIKPITSCRQLARTLSTDVLPSKSPQKESPVIMTRPGRLFLFLLWWNEESRDWSATWQYFTQHIFRPGDRVILSDGTKVLEIRSPQREKKKLSDFFAHMNTALKQKKLDKSRNMMELEKSIHDFDQSLRSVKLGKVEKSLFADFKMRYRGVLEEYRLARLKAQPRMLNRLATALRAVEAEKWALVFMQNERLPMLHRNSRLFSAPMSQQTAKELGEFIDEFDRKITMATDMAAHARDLRSLFTGANATFHLFLSDAANEVQDTEQVRWTAAFSSWESTFRSISKDTGGQVSNTTRLEEAMRRAAQRRDIFYVLTYKTSAQNEGPPPRLRVKTVKPGLRTVYARRLKAMEIRPLEMTAPEWRDGKLNFKLSGFMRETIASGNLAGDLRILIRAERDEGESIESTKQLRPESEATSVEIALNFPVPGRYLLTVEARDSLGGNQARGYTRVEIASSPRNKPNSSIQFPRKEEMSPQLAVVMDKAATYCRRLKKAAFRFYCSEWVDETTLEKRHASEPTKRVSRHWRYDYQVVGDETIREQRRLIRDGRKRMNVKNVKLNTRIKSRYSVFMPVTLLAVENRDRYHYRLLEAEQIRNRPCAVVDVMPRPMAEKSITHGRVWIDIDDGSVLRIEVNPKGIQGSEALIKAARQMSARLELTASHWYLEKRGGLRFPSLTEFSEAYVFDKLSRTRMRTRVAMEKHGVVKYVQEPYEDRTRKRVELYHLRQQYKDYRFFHVKTRVKVQEQ